MALREKTLVIVRHAHREKTHGHERDNGISRKGKVQAERLGRYFKKHHGGGKPSLLSSPKVRCIETLLPIAKSEKCEVELSPLLDEQHEGDKEFARRIQKFHRWWRLRGPKLTVICSHGDWIPRYLQTATGAMSELKKGGWAEITLTGDEIRLRWLLQELTA